MLKHPLNYSHATKSARKILKFGTVSYTRHAQQRQIERKMNQVDCANVLRWGQCDGHRNDDGEDDDDYTYRIATNEMTVIVCFRSEEHLAVVTCWRGGNK